MDINNVKQENLNAANIAGRDLQIQNHIYNISTPQNHFVDSKLKELLQAHENEKQNDPCYRKFSEELNNFFKTSLQNQRSLDQKLTAANRQHLIELASELKDSVTKKIERHAFFKSAQDIYTYLLTQIRTTFTHEVQSKIKSGKFEAYAIDEIINNDIITPLLLNLNGSSLHIDKSELYGLLYFLTGNCYVEWD